MTVLGQAEKAIAHARQGDMLSTVLGHDQFPATEVEVEWQQVSHQFAFGVSGEYDPEIAGALLRAGINRGQASLTWDSVSHQRDSWDLESRLEQTGAKTLHEMGMRTVATDLLLSGQGAIPREVARLSPTAYLIAAQRHVRRLAEELTGRVSIWEAVSQANLAAGGHLVEPELIVRLAERIVPILHEIDPMIPVSIGFETPISQEEVLDPVSLLSRLADAEVGYDRIGLRIYENGYDHQGHLQHRRSLTELSSYLDQFGRFDKPVDILGFAVPGAPNGSDPAVAGHWGRQWSPELQAVYLRAALTLAFSKPHIRGMTWTGTLDADALVPSGGLFSSATVAKPALHALAQCIERWTTDGRGEVDVSGHLRFRGYGGQYRVIVRDRRSGRETVQQVRLRERELHAVTIVLPGYSKVGS